LDPPVVLPPLIWKGLGSFVLCPAHPPPKKYFDLFSFRTVRNSAPNHLPWGGTKGQPPTPKQTQYHPKKLKTRPFRLGLLSRLQANPFPPKNNHLNQKNPTTQKITPPTPTPSPPYSPPFTPPPLPLRPPSATPFPPLFAFPPRPHLPFITPTYHLIPPHEGTNVFCWACDEGFAFSFPLVLFFLKWGSHQLVPNTVLHQCGFSHLANKLWLLPHALPKTNQRGKPKRWKGFQGGLALFLFPRQKHKLARSEPRSLAVCGFLGFPSWTIFPGFTFSTQVKKHFLVKGFGQGKFRIRKRDPPKINGCR